MKNTFKLSDYGLPPAQQEILLMTGTELLAITDILKDIVNQADHEPNDTLKKIDELEKPFKQNLNSGKIK